MGFARKAKKEGESKKEEEKEAVDVMKFILEDVATLLIRGERNSIVRRSDAESAGKDKVYLENLENCDVYLPFLLKAAYLKGVSNCRVYIGCVEGACFVNGATDCVIHVCAH